MKDHLRPKTLSRARENGREVQYDSKHEGKRPKEGPVEENKGSDWGTDGT